MTAENPYDSVTVSGFNADPPPDDGARTAVNQLEWSKHVDKLGQPNKTAIEEINTNVSTAFDALIITTDPAQEGLIEAARRFIPRVPDMRVEARRILALVEGPLSENQIIINRVFS